VKNNIDRFDSSRRMKCWYPWAHPCSSPGPCSIVLFFALNLMR